MTAVLTMPRMGETMESGRVAAWLKKPGDTFRRGETILEIETDKVTVEMPALDDGRLVEILAAEGSQVAVGEALGRYDQSKPTPSSASAAALGETDPVAPVAIEAVALTPLILPRMGETMEEGRVVAWMRRPGQSFKRGDVIVEIETDKTTVEMPALDDGRLVEIVAPPGATVSVGDPIGHYAPDAIPGSGPAFDPGAPEVPAMAAMVDAASAAPAGGDQEHRPDGVPTTRLRATPRARRIARNGGIDLATLTGSGRRARIERRDVEAALASGNATLAVQADVCTPDVHVLDLPGGRLAYRDWIPATVRGTVLFLHGFGADSATWSSFAVALSRQGLRVIVPDLPGHGATGIAAEAPQDMAPLVLAFAETLGLRDSHLVAHSMGAAVAVGAVAAGLRPARLTLVAPAGLGSEIDADFIAGLAHVRTPGALSHLRRRLARRVPPLSRTQLERMAAELARGRLERLADNLVENGRQAIDIVDDLRSLEVPTRIVWGVEDRIIPWIQAAQVPSAIPIHLIAGAGHMPHWDVPKDFAALFT